eukprot:4809860-Pleurochrysis_carterae.AAC.1
MNEVLARALVEVAAPGRVGTGEPGSDESGVRKRGIQGGHVADGPALTPPLRAAVEEARARPSPFASFRNL